MHDIMTTFFLMLNYLGTTLYCLSFSDVQYSLVDLLGISSLKITSYFLGINKVILVISSKIPKTNT
jgi:hypothetical protein